MANNSKQKKASAFMKPVDVTPELAAITGAGPMPRTEITKKVWDYIKKHGLQDPNKKRIINPDELLTKILGPDPIDMFAMTSKISKHIKEPVSTS